MLTRRMWRFGKLARWKIKIPKSEILAPRNTKTDLPDTDSLWQRTFNFYTSPNVTGTLILDCEFCSPLGNIIQHRKGDDDGKRHRNTRSHSEQRVARVSDDIFQVIVNDFTIRENFLASVVFPLFYRFDDPFMIVRVLSERIEDICSLMNRGELKERDKILDVLEQLPLTEVFDQRITERAVMHRKRNTDIAQDRDESFQVSISRRIVAILDKWMEEIFSVMNSGELEERDKILDVLKHLPLSKVFDQRITERAVMHRKHNTDIAQDRDESFQVSVSRRIVAIVVKWMEEIFRVVYVGELEEGDKFLDVFEQLPLTEVFDQRITGRDSFPFS
ncbi:PREDICTED: uncharacterized protein LOC107357263 [Acropora digitifera]|uniref:uncharacterized protein LOC107357263 n=1 Tax=Acropora digitifera TaxID=70779 RepID=UPI00077AB579|nr:PREDICTED: uncharacterized protein LOC107357263 [Acropora digitifera]